MISIVLPTYNGSKYIRQSLDSILNQTYKDWELIIVNDASTDNTAEIIEEYAKKDSRIHIITNKKNKKLPASLNIGFREAKGSYYTWTSDDNMYAANALERMILELKNNKSIDFVYSLMYVIDDKGRLKRKNWVYDSEELYLKSCIGASFLYKKKVHKILNGYDVNKFLIEDWDFFLRAKREGFIFCKINEFLYYYRISNNSLSATKKDEINKRVNKALLDNIFFLNRNLNKKNLEIILHIIEEIFEKNNGDIKKMFCIFGDYLIKKILGLL